MKLFGFELVGLQTMAVKCPRGDHTAEIIFKPSDVDSVLSPKESVALTGEAGELIHPPLELLRCNDLHFLCMKCGVSFHTCEKTKQPCQIILSEHFKAITSEGT